MFSRKNKVGTKDFRPKWFLLFRKKILSKHDPEDLCFLLNVWNWVTGPLLVIREIWRNAFGKVERIIMTGLDQSQLIPWGWKHHKPMPWRQEGKQDAIGWWGSDSHCWSHSLFWNWRSNPKTSNKLTYTKQPQHLTWHIILEELPSLALSFLTCYTTGALQQLSSDLQPQKVLSNLNIRCGTLPDASPLATQVQPGRN